LRTLWEQLEQFGARLSEPVPEKKDSLPGLTSAEARERLHRFGPNQAILEKRIGFTDRLWQAVKNPLVILLAVLGTISYLTDDLRSAVVIIGMAVLGVTLKIIQESKADTAAEQLKKMVHTTATVLRDGTRREIPLAKVVPGDVVFLSAGDMIPADMQLLRAKDLHINQSMLTGEALPVEKAAVSPDQVNGNLKPDLSDPSMCFMGTNVVSGSAAAVAIATGPRTYFGGIAAKLSRKREESDFDKGIKSFTMLMLRFMLFMVPFVFVVNGVLKHDWSEAFMFALAVAVGLTPEMLPMVVTVCLSKGALAMSKRKVIVKRLESIQNFGAIDVLCTDKTGTLTQDKIILEKHLDVLGREDDGVLELAYVNSSLQTGLKSALDHAVIAYGNGQEGRINPGKYAIIDEVPFDFIRRRLSVVVRDTEQQRSLIICKGAAEEVFRKSSYCLVGGQVTAIDETHREIMERVVQDLNEDGFRVVAVGWKEVDGARREFSVADEEGLILIGYLAFLDPPKESAAEALAVMRGHGITPKILTGDNVVITMKICREVKLDYGDHVVTGEELAGLSGEALIETVEKHHVFAKLDPMQKELIVTTLRHSGHVVGFMGDGINDAPALKAADVGISVDSAVDVAKESADIILLEKSLSVLESGVMEGAQGLQQHHQIHPHGGQFQFRQYVQRTRGQYFPAILAHAAHSDPHQQSDVRFFPDRHSHGQRGRGFPGQAPALAHRRYSALYPFSWSGQFHFRLYHVFRYADRFQRLGQSRFVPDRLVYRIAVVPDLDRPRHSDRPTALFPEPVESASGPHHADHLRRGHLAAVLPPGRGLRIGGPARALLEYAGVDFIQLHVPDPGGQNLGGAAFPARTDRQCLNKGNDASGGRGPDAPGPLATGRGLVSALPGTPVDACGS